MPSVSDHSQPGESARSKLFDNESINSDFTAMLAENSDGLGRMHAIESKLRQMAQRGHHISRAMLKQLLQEKKKKNEDSRRLLNYMRMFTRVKTGADPATLDELKDACPPFFEPEDWQESLIYVYFAVNYSEEDLFRWLLIRANYFEGHERLNKILG